MAGDSVPDVYLLPALLPVVEALESLGIPYRIGGSVASSVHGLPRATNDFDLVADIRSDQVEPLCQLLADRYYAEPLMLAEAVRLQSCANFLHFATAYKVDLFVRRRAPFDVQAFERFALRPLDDAADARSFPILTPEDTILHKLVWYRKGGEVSDRQWNDVRGVLQVQHGRLDEAYLDRWAQELGIEDLLARARNDSSA